MNFFRNLQIRGKMILILLCVSALSLFLFSSLDLYRELQLFKKNMVRNLTVLASTVGANSRAAIVFNDAVAGKRILSSLKEEPQIDFAALYDKDGKIFVTYSRDEAVPFEPPEIKDERYKIGKTHFEIVRNILLEDKVIGKIYLRSHMEELQAEFRNYAFLAGIMLFVTLAIAFFVSVKLQSIISRPILSLAEVAKKISNESDYSIRAHYESKDELGILYSGFNEMLEQIQKETTERKRAEKEIKRYAADLEKANEELRDFTFTASHDLQEPLRKVITFGYRLEKAWSGNQEKEALSYIERMQTSAFRMRQLIEDLLKFSRTAAKVGDFQSVNLEEVVEEVILDLEIQIEESKGAVKVEALPTLNADKRQMLQLFQNLISNGLKFARPGQPPMVSLKSVLLPDGYWKILVEDNGIGIDGKYQDRIFKPFERLHASGEYQGSGMGLAICNKIVSRHKGTITAESSANQGTRFVITLPEKQAD